MSEVRLYEGAFPFTKEWYAGREHAPHLEQAPHVERLIESARLASMAVRVFDAGSIVDLGCGDGGLLSLLGYLGVDSFGYDLMVPNVRYGRTERDVDVRLADFLTDEIKWGQLAICTEVLEHLENPHAFVRKISEHSDYLVASSPASETAEHHCAEHAWAWDQEGYQAMLAANGFSRLIDNVLIDNGDMEFQIVLVAVAA